MRWDDYSRHPEELKWYSEVNFFQVDWFKNRKGEGEVIIPIMSEPNSPPQCLISIIDRGRRDQARKRQIRTEETG